MRTWIFNILLIVVAVLGYWFALEVYWGSHG
jgi:hypothetical protein